MNNDEVKKAWQGYWTVNQDNEITFDEMSGAIFSELAANSGDFKDKKILEAGCGRGLISARIAEHGAQVYLLDISTEALKIAEKLFSARKLEALASLGDILDPPFEESSFDIVWNSGVMEHFDSGSQAEALKKIAGLLKPGGLFVTFNPYEKACFYMAGKKAAEEKGIWPYGPEFPVGSMKEKCNEAGLAVLKEYSICFKENLSYLSYLSKSLRSAAKLLLSPFPESFLIRLFGGYLLVTVASKQ